MDARRAKLFFPLVSHLYTRVSIVLTSNVPFDAWGRVFGGDEVIAAGTAAAEDQNSPTRDGLRLPILRHAHPRPAAVPGLPTLLPTHRTRWTVPPLRRTGRQERVPDR